MNDVLCDNCGEIFNITTQCINMEDIGNNYKREYMECPHCLTKFTILYTNDYIEELKREWEKENKNINSPTYKKIRAELKKVNNYFMSRNKE